MEAPKKEIEFIYPRAEITEESPSQITLKVDCPKTIPVGSIIEISSSNKTIQPDSEKLTIRSEALRPAKTGESVAVVNFDVVGGKAGEEGKLKACVGSFCDEMEIVVVAEDVSARKKGPKQPRILLSGVDDDPLGIAPTGRVILTERDPLVYQRIHDVQEGIYWINTASPLAKAILKRHGGPRSERWRDYLFQRHVEIIVKQALYELENKEPDGFHAARIDSDLFGVLVRKIHEAAAEELEGYFFSDEFVPTQSGE